MVIKGNDGYLRVDYIQLIPVMIEAIKKEVKTRNRPT